MVQLNQLLIIVQLPAGGRSILSDLEAAVNGCELFFFSASGVQIDSHWKISHGTMLCNQICEITEFVRL